MKYQDESFDFVLNEFLEEDQANEVRINKYWIGRNLINLGEWYKENKNGYIDFLKLLYLKDEAEVKIHNLEEFEDDLLKLPISCAIYIALSPNLLYNDKPWSGVELSLNLFKAALLSGLKNSDIGKLAILKSILISFKRISNKLTFINNSLNVKLFMKKYGNTLHKECDKLLDDWDNNCAEHINYYPRKEAEVFTFWISCCAPNSPHLMNLIAYAQQLGLGIKNTKLSERKIKVNFLFSYDYLNQDVPFGVHTPKYKNNQPLYESFKNTISRKLRYFKNIEPNV